MQKVIIKLDEKKLIDNGYDVDGTYNEIDKVFQKFNLKVFVKESNLREYVDTGNKDDFGNIWSINESLYKSDWFMKCIEKWLYMNSDSSDDPNDFIIEDILKEWE